MLNREAKQLNFYSTLYHRIPEKHILKLINSAISFNFIYDLVKDSYCSHFGRPAKDPEMIVRILILQRLYDLSDERVMEELQVNLAYMCHNFWLRQKPIAVQLSASIFAVECLLE